MKDKHVIHARHLFPIKVNPKKRDDLILHLQNHGVGVVVNYRCLSNYSTLISESVYTDKSFVHSTLFGDSVLSLPLYPQIKKSELNYVVKTISNFFLYSD